ncbi:ABC transporter substrate-binding protein [Brevibacillus reuszeri]|uniref:ABC transporter substrate-binding protein n=1 Tax=Brevibacillus reuszeri TaxID=54915 RepID=UPI000CCC809C|nr:ABC transporter substrate-binding protein [Brevibacillus reuszeri]
MVKNRKRSRFFTVCKLAVIAMLVVSGCSGGTSDADIGVAKFEQDIGQPQNGGTITVGYPQEPDTFDVHKSNGASVTDEIAGLMGGTLVYMDPTTHEIKPHLAESYTITPDGKTWTFKIRSGITFHDGTLLTAKTYKETFDRIFDPKTKATSVLSTLGAVKRVKAPDDQTLILELKEPFAPLLINLSIPGWLQPLSMKAIEKSGTDYGRNPVGVGPWKFESWQPGQTVTLTRNDQYKWAEPYYENRGQVRPDKLVFKFVIDKQTRLAALDSGSIDIAINVPAKDIKKYRSSEEFEVIERMRSGIGLLLEMNMRTEALQDVEVRKALNMAINKEAIIQAALQGEGEIAHSFLPPTFFGYDKAVEELDYKYSQEEAKKLLDAAGWKMGADGTREKNGKKLSLTLLSSESQAKETQLVQAMLGEVGIKVTINNMDPAAMLDAASKGQFDLTVMSYTDVDPDIFYLFFHSSQIGVFNDSAINDPKLDELLVKGRTTVDLEARKQVYSEVQKYMIEQAYLVPIYIDKQFIVVNRRVKGLKLSPDRLLYTDTWVAQ